MLLPLLLPLLFLLPLASLAKSPNIVMVLTDDQVTYRYTLKSYLTLSCLHSKYKFQKMSYLQDTFLDGMTPLVKTRKLIGEQGTTFQVRKMIPT